MSQQQLTELIGSMVNIIVNSSVSLIGVILALMGILIAISFQMQSNMHSARTMLKADKIKSIVKNLVFAMYALLMAIMTGIIGLGFDYVPANVAALAAFFISIAILLAFSYKVIGLMSEDED